MKKLLVFMLCGLVLVGCGKTNSENEVVEESQTEASTETKEVVSEQPVEESEDIARVEPEVQLDLDITGCDTFTQIVDRVLEPGMVYTNEDIGDTDALLVCSGAYDNMDGNMAAIDAAIYVYNDGVPECIGYVNSMGTAYPLAVKDGYLYVGIYHGTAKYTIENNKLVEADSAWIESDENGGEFYYSQDGDDKVEMDNADKVEKLEAEYADATVLNFDVIK